MGLNRKNIDYDLDVFRNRIHKSNVYYTIQSYHIIIKIKYLVVPVLKHLKSESCGFKYDHGNSYCKIIN